MNYDIFIRHKDKTELRPSWAEDSQKESLADCHIVRLFRVTVGKWIGLAIHDWELGTGYMVKDTLEPGYPSLDPICGNVHATSSDYPITTRPGTVLDVVYVYFHISM